jgi:hypothetical protein
MASTHIYAKNKAVTELCRYGIEAVSINIKAALGGPREM